VQKHGAAIVDIIESFCREKGLSANLPFPEIQKKKKTKLTTDTKLQSLELFQEGKTIDEIAALRDLKTSTIESHLGHFVGKGELDISQLMDAEIVKEIETYFMSYGQLRMVVSYMQKEK